MATLTSNVEVQGTWYGPDYPDAGDPPDGAILNAAAYGAADVYDQHLSFREDDFAAMGKPTGTVATEELAPATGLDPHPRASRQEESATEEAQTRSRRK